MTGRLSNYPPGMSRLDLQHVGELDPDDEEEEAEDHEVDDVEWYDDNPSWLDKI